MNLKTMSLCLALLALGGCNSPGDEPQPAANAAVPADPGPAPGIKRQPSPNAAAVRFLNLQDGAVVSNPVRLEFEITGMDLVPAGTVAENSGHHHLLIDAALPDLTVPIPADAKHLHFGDGSRSTELNLPSGEHTLQLLFADYLHIPHDAPVYSNRITIKVE
ncbi:MAG: DUF4399 domain-containing protein [Woeseia sp.]